MEAFSDGVFGFAITLLAVNLAIHPPGGPLQQLLHGWPSYVAYLIRFLTIGGAWLGHEALTDRLTRVDPIFLRINLLVLLGVAVLAFSLDAYARREHLYSTPDSDEELSTDQRKSLPIIIGFVIAVLIGLALPRVTIALYFALAVYLLVPFRLVAQRPFRGHRSGK